MLKVDKLFKQANLFTLNPVSFELPKGYLMGLIGKNGSGKSTLIKTLLNIYTMDLGDVYIDGYSIRTQEQKAKDLLGAVLDENFFEEELSAAENAAMYGAFYTNYDSSLFKRYMTEFDVDAKRKLKKLSKGEQMKFQLAFALSHHPSLLILDEPTASLDPSFRKEMLSILSDLLSDGEHSVLLSTHLTDDLDRIADYIAFLDQGTLKFCTTKEDLTSRYTVVTGEDYKIRLLPKELVIYSEKKEYCSSALIRNLRFTVLPDGLTAKRPKIDDIMYYMLKGGFEHV